MSEFSDIIYKSVDSILNVLKRQENYSLHPVRQLVDKYEAVYEEETVKHVSDNLHAFIVLEGLDGCGKSTMCKRLANTLNAEIFGTPPKCLLTLRPIFDGPEYQKLRPLFYSLGNYIAALQMKTILQSKPIVLDRFWYSTASYAIAQAVEDYPERYSIPPINDDIYKWPEDLLRPDVILFLTVSEEVRKLRLRRREELTMQENLLAAKKIFRNNVVEIYKRMENPKVIFVNGQRSKANTEKGLLMHLQNFPEFKDIPKTFE